MSDIRNLIIIGTGPAGLTAGIYSGRASLSPLIFEGHEPGGQLTLTTDVENFPGFSKGIQGPDLMHEMREQAKRFGAEFLQKSVSKVDFSTRPFKVYVGNEEYLSHSVIISTGASAKFLGLKGEKELTGKGVSTCATCDGFFYRDKIVHVVGGGDTAMEEATFLTKFASSVTIIHRRDSLKASVPMQERAKKNPKIKFLWDSEVLELKSDSNGLTGIQVKNLKTNETSERKTDGLFYGIGHIPNTSFLDNQLKLDDHGLIVTKPGHPETSIPGIFACGDVQDNEYRQAITAAGTGCMAAMRAEKYLEQNF